MRDIKEFIEHAAWNAKHYPGTRQLCNLCGSETGRCKEDSMYLDDGTGPVCYDCYCHEDELKFHEE